MASDFFAAARASRAAVFVLALAAVQSLGLTAATRAWADDSKPSAAADAQLERARVIVGAAERLFVAGHYDAALAEYSRAYEALDGHPRQYWVLHNLAACNERLFRYDIALKLYEEYLRRAPPTEEDRAEVAAIMRTLQSLLATLAVESQVPGEVWVDDRRMGTAPGRWLVPTGRHIVEFRAALYESERREIQLGAGRFETLRFNPQRLSTYRGPEKAYFWAALGATGVAAVTGATLGAMALSASDTGHERAELHLDTSEDAQKTRTLAFAADTAFGAALFFGVTATVLYFITDWSPGPQPGSASSRAPRKAPLAVGRAGRALILEF